jgi:predicted ArsR family transcriptional regulator
LDGAAAVSRTGRTRILEFLRRDGEATARQLAAFLGVTTTAVRQQNAVLEREGLVAITESRGHAGRPALVYSLTPAANAAFPNRHDDLANLLLDQIRASGGSQGLQTALMRVAARSAEPYEGRVKGREIGERVAETAAIINERGNLADSAAAGDSYLIHQYTCPFPNVAPEHSGVCALEVEFVRRLSGGDARLVRSLLRGDRSCTYRIRP